MVAPTSQSMPPRTVMAGLVDLADSHGAIHSAYVDALVRVDVGLVNGIRPRAAG
jgi:hypothetical protein